MTKRVNKDAERLNPCLKESEQSYACLSKNNYDASKCEAYFDNYNVCKKFWGSIYNERRAKGIQPYLPEPEEREKLKEEFAKKVRGQT